MMQIAESPLYQVFPVTREACMMQIAESPRFTRDTLEFRHVTILRDGHDYSYPGPFRLASWATEDRVADDFLRELSQIPEELYDPIPGIRERWLAEVERTKGISAPFGVPGTRYDLELEYVDSGHVTWGEYGPSVKHTFRNGSNIYHWWTNKNVTLARGAVRSVKATVKEHRGGETILTRVSPIKGTETFVTDIEREHD